MDKQFRMKIPIEPIVMGKIGAAYGIRGWLKVFSFTEKAESIFNYQPWFIKIAEEWLLVGLERWKWHNHNLIIKVMDIEDRAAAAMLTNYEIIVDAMQLPVLNDDEYYWKDLLGCQVLTIGGCQLGIVINLMETGSNDILVVKSTQKDAFYIQERLIPFIYKQVIKNVNLVRNVIIVDWDPDF